MAHSSPLFPVLAGATGALVLLVVVTSSRRAGALEGAPGGGPSPAPQPGGSSGTPGGAGAALAPGSGLYLGLGAEPVWVTFFRDANWTTGWPSNAPWPHGQSSIAFGPGDHDYAELESTGLHDKISSLVVSAPNPAAVRVTLYENAGLGGEALTLSGTDNGRFVGQSMNDATSAIRITVDQGVAPAPFVPGADPFLPLKCPLAQAPLSLLCLATDDGGERRAEITEDVLVRRLGAPAAKVSVLRTPLLPLQDVQDLLPCIKAAEGPDPDNWINAWMRTLKAVGAAIPIIGPVYAQAQTQIEGLADSNRKAALIDKLGVQADGYFPNLHTSQLLGGGPFYVQRLWEQDWPSPLEALRSLGSRAAGNNLIFDYWTALYLVLTRPLPELALLREMLDLSSRVNWKVKMLVATASYQAALAVLDEALSYGSAQAESADAQVFRALCQVALFSQEAYWRKATGVACPPQTQSFLEAQRDAGWTHLNAWKAAGVAAAQPVVLAVTPGKP